MEDCEKCYYDKPCALCVFLDKKEVEPDTQEVKFLGSLPVLSRNVNPVITQRRFNRFSRDMRER